MAGKYEDMAEKMRDVSKEVKPEETKATMKPGLMFDAEQLPELKNKEEGEDVCIKVYGKVSKQGEDKFVIAVDKASVVDMPKEEEPKKENKFMKDDNEDKEYQKEIEDNKKEKEEK